MVECSPIMHEALDVSLITRGGRGKPDSSVELTRSCAILPYHSRHSLPQGLCTGSFCPPPYFPIWHVPPPHTYKANSSMHLESLFRCSFPKAHSDHPKQNGDLFLHTSSSLVSCMRLPTYLMPFPLCLCAKYFSLHYSFMYLSIQ